MLDEEGSLHFFVARFNDLTGVVMVKPLAQGPGAAIVAIAQQRGIVKCSTDLEAFERYDQRIRTVVQEVLATRHHLGILAHLAPRWSRRQRSEEHTSEL